MPVIFLRHHHPRVGAGKPAKAAGQYGYKGKAYYFCSVSCLERFGADPEKALNKKSLNVASSNFFKYST